MKVLGLRGLDKKKRERRRGEEKKSKDRSTRFNAEKVVQVRCPQLKGKPPDLYAGRPEKNKMKKKKTFCLLVLCLLAYTAKPGTSASSYSVT